MSKLIRNVIIVIVVGFFLYFLFTRPEESAAAVKSFFSAFESIVRFFEALASKGG
ncbi:MAG: hypothetical protein FWG08_05295 [Propionibacteriaceae bacterium]|nr:hypothetical protein [Propionibacteriaceae bacterium]